MIPLRLRQLPTFAKETIKRFAVLRRQDPGDRTFHLCFFSCQSYFRYLYCALHSITKHIQGVSFNILIFSDTDQPLSEAQIAAIKELVPSSRVLPWPKSMGWGATQISWIWRAYGVAAETAKDNDIIARIDSDVFFFNETIFKSVVRSEADLIGDGHYVNFDYCQGGCYFFKADAVRKINRMIEAEGMDVLLSEVSIVVEDVAATHFARRLGLKIWQSWFMMFPDELRNAGGLTSWYKWKFSCLHFVMKNKAAMLETYEREVLNGTSSDQYRQTLETP